MTSKKLTRVALDALFFDAELGEWNLAATFEAAGEPPHQHVVSFRQELVGPASEQQIRSICVRAALIAADHYQWGDFQGAASATDFHAEADLEQLTAFERAALFGEPV